MWFGARERPGYFPPEICENDGCTNRLRQEVITLSGEASRDVYRPLDVDTKEIRLVQIKPGDRDSLIECTLRYTSLFTSQTPEELIPGSHEFESDLKAEASDQAVFLWRALSYSWGVSAHEVPKDLTNKNRLQLGPRADYTIYINNIPVQIGPNLFEALTWLRYHGYVDPIWIDALSIDQANDTERASQVAIMGDIYHSAGEVLINLPIDISTNQELYKENNPPAMKYEGEEHLIKALFTATSVSSDKPIGEKPLNDLLDMWLNSSRYDVFFEALEATIAPISYNTSYWNRFWTLQECLSSRKSTLVCGLLVLPWDKAVQLSVAMQSRASAATQIEGALETFETFESYETYKASAAGRTAAAAIAAQAWEENRRHPLMAVRLVNKALLLRDEQRRSAGSISPLRALELSNSSPYCSDARDLIYGAMSFVSEASPSWSNMRISYRQCVSCVWLNAAIAIIEDTNSLDLLGHCSFSDSSYHEMHDDNNGQRSSRSWVPTFGELKLPLDNYNFCGGFDARWSISDDREQLRATGFVLGSVGEYGKYTDFRSTEIAQIGRAVETLDQDLKEMYGDDDATRKQCLADVARLLAAPGTHESSDQIALQYLFAVYSDLGSTTPSTSSRIDLSDGSKRRCYEVLSSHWVTVWTRRSNRPLLAFIQSGDFESDDDICGVLGCRSALVVRHTPHGDHIIGSCIVVGYGHGEISVEIEAGEIICEDLRFT